MFMLFGGKVIDTNRISTIGSSCAGTIVHVVVDDDKPTRERLLESFKTVSEANTRMGEIADAINGNSSKPADGDLRIAELEQRVADLEATIRLLLRK